MGNVVRKSLAVGVLDFETDPFEFGNVPYPFACGVYFTDDDYILLWEPDIIDKTIALLHSLKPCILYAHNGGKFDFQYLLDWANEGEIIIRNSRVTQMSIGDVMLVDTWPLMPFALAEYQKTKIDYRKFTKARRRKHKDEISKYCIDDCRNLLTLVKGFKAIVGEKDTIGGAAFHQMKKLGIEIENTNEQHDDVFRQFFYGGRVQAFDKGVHAGPFKYLDINSAYPYAMTFDHPHGTDYRCSRRLPKRLGANFVHCIADSCGALPLRADDGSLDFPIVKDAEFFVTGWELAAGIKTKTVKVRKVLEAWTPENLLTFDCYVQKFFPLKAEAKARGDTIHYLAYKYLTNSGYGKLAQNPRDFRSYTLARYGFKVPGHEWECDFGALSLWSAPSYNGFGFYDVATGASITGFVRAMLWTAIKASNRVLYVDTDSMLCKSSTVHLGSRLGEWKLEGKVKEARIGGKKLYGVKFDDGEIRIASKGARLTWGEMLELCNGKAIKWQNDAPTFSLGKAHFVERTLTST